MSFIDDIIDVGGSILGGAINLVKSDGIGGTLARTALLGLAVNKMTKSINKDTASTNNANNPERVDPGVRLQVNPDPSHKIPVVYGTAILGGIITDARISADYQTMYYCITLCEKTGNTNLGTGPVSSFTIDQVWINGQVATFSGTNRYQLESTTDSDGNVDYNNSCYVGIYCFDGGSASTNCKAVGGYVDTLYSAYSLMPGWDASWTMNNLVFAIVTVRYNREGDLRGVPDIKFKISNSMKQPGDCLYDYMTNTRYGAGIPAASIYTS